MAENLRKSEYNLLTLLVIIPYGIIILNYLICKILHFDNKFAF